MVEDERNRGTGSQRNLAVWEVTPAVQGIEVLHPTPRGAKALLENQVREEQKEAQVGAAVVLFLVRGGTETPRCHLPVLGLASHELYHAAHRDH